MPLVKFHAQSHNLNALTSLLPGTTQAHTKPEENSAPAGLSRSETLRAALYFLGEALSGAATFPREEEPEAGVGPRERARKERMEEGRVPRGRRRDGDDGEGRRTTRLEDGVGRQAGEFCERTKPNVYAAQSAA